MTMVRIKIFDVDHGFCAAVEADDYHHLLIDCGYNAKNGFHPTRYLVNHSIRRLNYLIIPTFVEGSLAGFYDLLGNSLSNCFSIDRLLTNPSIDAESLPELAVRNFSTLNSLMLLGDACKQCDKIERVIHIGNIELSFFWNSYPTFLDFSNLSLVTFLSSQGVNILFPGNLKVEGWRTLLQNARFRDQLRRVNLLVASNHGQEDGYCPEIFNYCNPDLIIISNHNHQVSSTVIRQYRCQMGRIWKLSGQPRVIETCTAGTITLQQSSDHSLYLKSQRFKTYQIRKSGVCQA